MAYDDKPDDLKRKLEEINTKAQINTHGKQYTPTTSFSIEVEEDLSYEDYFTAIHTMEERQAEEMREAMINHLINSDIELIDNED